MLRVLSGRERLLPVNPQPHQGDKNEDDQQQQGERAAHTPHAAASIATEPADREKTTRSALQFLFARRSLVRLAALYPVTRLLSLPTLIRRLS
jgi:hypothetical protein